MKKLFIIVGIFSGITSQQTFNIPFDWAGQNGMVINNGKLFWNQTWTSGMLLFDGSYTSFPIKYGGHTSEKFSQNKLNFLPLFSKLPDSSKTKSFFDYYRGDYLYDQIELGGDFESKNEKIEVRGFKRSHGGNTGHYLHPLGGSSPIHHSYRVNYGVERKDQKFEASVARYITKSGLPDSVENGLENDNIINAGFRYQKQLEKFTLDTYFGQFLQSRFIKHSSVKDTNYKNINRNQYIIELTSKNKTKIGFKYDSQQINIINLNRSLNWSTIYVSKNFGGLFFQSGLQLLSPDQKQSFHWLSNYRLDLGMSSIEFSTNAISKPIHPTNSNKKDSDNFENWLNSQLKSGLKIGGFSASGFFQINKQDFDGINIANAQSIGFDINYNFNKKWKIYSNFLTQLDSSYVGGGLGSLLNVGINGEFNLFENNMNLKPHFWVNSISGRLHSFGFDPIDHMPFYHSNIDWKMNDYILLNFELTTNISGVLIHYRINNLLNAFGVSDDKAWVQNNYMYQKLGRMIQFGVTWNFMN